MITSFQNSLVKRVRRLRQKKYRQQEGVFFAEGLRVIASALELGHTPELLIWSGELLTSDFGRALVANAPCPTAEVSAELFRNLSERDNPAGLAALVPTIERPLHALSVKSNAVFVALHEIADPGNLGTILRTADAAGAAGVILVGPAVDAGHPNVARASMGALFNVPLAGVASFDELLRWAATHALQTVATSAHAAVDYTAAAYRRPLLLLMGSEREGLPGETLAVADLAVRIPMRGISSSLNLAVATALLLFECGRAR